METVSWLPWIWRRDRESLYFSWKQHDDLKKRTMDKTLESTLKAGMNSKLPTCDDKGVARFVDLLTPKLVRDIARTSELQDLRKKEKHNKGTIVLEFGRTAAWARARES